MSEMIQETNQEAEDKPLGYAWYMVTLCMIAYLFSFIDRQIVALLIEPIKADLNISDTQFSLIHGLAFAIFYAVMGVPIARLADTKSRPLIISIGINSINLSLGINSQYHGDSDQKQDLNFG